VAGQDAEPAGAPKAAPPPAITAPSSGFGFTSWGWAVVLVAFIVVIAAAIAILGIVGNLDTPRRSHQVSYASPVELPFTGLNYPAGVAVDTAGDVYITEAGHNRVLKLPAGSNTPVVLPFTGLSGPWGVAVDTAGDVYITDSHHNLVLKLPAA